MIKVENLSMLFSTEEVQTKDVYKRQVQHIDPE